MPTASPGHSAARHRVPDEAGRPHRQLGPRGRLVSHWESGPGVGVTEPPPLPRPGPRALLRRLPLPCDRRLSPGSRAAPRCCRPPCGGPRSGCATRAVSSGGTSGRSRFLAVTSAAVTRPSLSPGATRLVGATGAGRGAGPASPAWVCPPPPALVGRHRVLPSRRLAGVPRGSCPAARTLRLLLRPSVSRAASAAHTSPQ